MKPEMFVLKTKKDNRSDFSGEFHKKVSELITEINKNLEKKNYSARELYEIMISNGILKPTYFIDFEKIVRWGIREGFVNPNKLVSKVVKGVRLPRDFSKDKLMTIFHAIEDPMLGVACFLALFCGLRIGEVCTIKVTDIDFENELIKIVQGKRSKDRMSPFLKEYHDVIQKWIKYSGAKTYLFYSDVSQSMATRNTPHISTRQISNKFNQVIETTNIKELDERYKKQERSRRVFTFHSFRHTFATRHLERGVSPAFVKKALGHARMDTTVNVYGHMKDNVMIQALRGGGILNIKKEEKLVEIPKQEVVMTPLQLLAHKYANGLIDKREFITKTNTLKEMGVI